ncbi:helix-turn-helix domain-containing protein [Methylophilus sp. YYY-1]|uniref:helix-turn-helix domain-containing protein n=1 Tax=Methylophilus sp. YYY-1 TaxID=2682087 RepID=UPI0023B28F21|nr:helix-turn-helix domain-containing protein [Methylophilus sp. YYY-1]MDF0379021.1 hypothetical protein [Methylophilus sp. YYY-1]
MEAIDIIYRLQRIGKSQAQIARELGISTGVVNNVIHGRVTAHPVATHIATLLDLQIEALWPNQYTFKPRGPSKKRRSSSSDDISEGECE